MVLLFIYTYFFLHIQALKRRSYLLDDDTRSVGAMRRVRQKPNLSSHIGPLATSGAGGGYSPSQLNTTVKQKPLLLNDAKNRDSKDMEEIGCDGISSSSYSLVPSQSSEMATKILQHLEKFSAKEKSSGSDLVAARDRSPSKLTLNMLHGQALRSLEDVDSTQFLQKDGPKFEDPNNARLHDVSDLTPQKQSKDEETEVPPKLSTSIISNDDKTMSNISGIKNADSIISEVASQPPQQRRGFHMSAHEVGDIS